MIFEASSCVYVPSIKTHQNVGRFTEETRLDEVTIKSKLSFLNMP